jgi:1,4-dihydroxy-2-naphthoate octaprenyltransferase
MATSTGAGSFSGLMGWGWAMMLMARPQMIAAGVLVYALGVAMGRAASAGSVSWEAAGAGLLVFIAANLCAHYADEYADMDTDALSQRTWFSGGSGALATGRAKPRHALGAAISCAVTTVALAVYFVCRGALPLAAWPIIALGLVGGWCYSMPPLALERRGLGEIVNVILGAVLIPLLGFTTQTGAPTIQAALALLPICAITMVNLLGAHWADRRADAAVGKRTLTVILGARAVPLHRALTAATYVVTWLLGLTVLPMPVVVAITLTLPCSLWATRTFARTERRGASSAAMVLVIAAALVGWLLA